MSVRSVVRGFHPANGSGGDGNLMKDRIIANNLKLKNGISVGTVATPPLTATVGSVIFNSTLNTTQYFDKNGVWRNTSAVLPVIAGVPVGVEDTGSVKFDTTGNTMYVYDGGWLPIGGGGGGAVNTWERITVGGFPLHRPNFTAIGLGVLTDKLVWGSQTLYSTSSPAATETRMIFDPANSSFRVGYASGVQWDAANVGQYSFAAGQNNTASGLNSICLGGKNNTASGVESGVFCGSANIITSALDSAIVAGGTNTINIGGTHSAILCGFQNIINGSQSAIVAGTDNIVSGAKSAVLCGDSNQVNHANSSVLSGTGIITQRPDCATAYNLEIRQSSYRFPAVISGVATYVVPTSCPSVLLIETPITSVTLPTATGSGRELFFILNYVATCAIDAATNLGVIRITSSGAVGSVSLVNPGVAGNAYAIKLYDIAANLWFGQQMLVT